MREREREVCCRSHFLDAIHCSLWSKCKIACTKPLERGPMAYFSHGLVLLSLTPLCLLCTCVTWVCIHLCWKTWATMQEPVLSFKPQSLSLPWSFVEWRRVGHSSHPPDTHVQQHQTNTRSSSALQLLEHSCQACDRDRRQREELALQGRGGGSIGTVYIIIYRHTGRMQYNMEFS